MKKKALVMFLLVTITFSIDNVVSAQQSKWVKQKGNSPTESLTIAEKEDTSVWLVCDNQLSIVFKTKFKKDTAFFYVVSSDQGNVFSTLHHAKEGTLFAKGTLVSKEKIRLTYFDKSFIKTVNSVYANAFPNELYRAVIKKKSIEEMLKNRQGLTNKYIDNMNGNIPTLAQASRPTQRISVGDDNDKAAIGQDENHQEIKSNLYILYVKSLSTIKDIDVKNYYNFFDPLPDGLNEFQQQKYLLLGKEKLDSIKNDNSTALNDRKFITTVNLSNYNFEKNGFSIKEIKDDENFTLLQKGVYQYEMSISFRNINRNILIPFDAGKAEELTNKNFNGSERILYCIYTFNYTDSKFGISMYKWEFNQNALVQSIDFYTDKECTQKIATVTLN